MAFKMAFWNDSFCCDIKSFKRDLFDLVYREEKNNVISYSDLDHLDHY